MSLKINYKNIQDMKKLGKIFYLSLTMSDDEGLIWIEFKKWLISEIGGLSASCCVCVCVFEI